MPRPTSLEFAVATHVLAFLAMLPTDRTVSSVELSGRTNTNPVYVRRVLGPLRRAGIVESRAGRHGGWHLSVAPGSIDLGGLWRLFNGDAGIVGVHAPHPGCVVGRSVTDQLIALRADAGRDVENSLSRHTIADVVARSEVSI